MLTAAHVSACQAAVHVALFIFHLALLAMKGALIYNYCTVVLLSCRGLRSQLTVGARQCRRRRSSSLGVALALNQETESERPGSVREVVGSVRGRGVIISTDLPEVCRDF